MRISISGFLADERTYDVAAALLHELGIRRIRLLTNNPQKINSLRDHGIEVVGRMPLVTTSNMHNERYLRAKHERAGHSSPKSRAANAAFPQLRLSREYCTGQPGGYTPALNCFVQYARAFCTCFSSVAIVSLNVVTLPCTGTLIAGSRW